MFKLFYMYMQHMYRTVGQLVNVIVVEPNYEYRPLRQQLRSRMRVKSYDWLASFRDSALFDCWFPANTYTWYIYLYVETIL